MNELQSYFSCFFKTTMEVVLRASQKIVFLFLIPNESYPNVMDGWSYLAFWDGQGDTGRDHEREKGPYTRGTIERFVKQRVATWQGWSRNRILSLYARLVGL